ncbi:tripartite tricarboxylate transporter TctB family protein [Marispirochaeta aestuarii]|uniref:tripartite tricarboxylate transporter TctB family protein n=1 Tax=Marispirochaeta aestuarii TaxID=1963862 RepID=UPI0029C84840|nr:tripartite tricarboxylate transporter TctB family protein [Marispirochaeta aestuarii]
MAKANVVIGSIFFLLALLMFAVALDFPKPQVSGLSPRVFPQFVAVCTMIFSAMLIVKNVRLLAGKDTVVQEKKKLDSQFAARFGIFSAAGVLYVLLIDKIGYLIATPILIAATMLLFNEKRWFRVLMVSVLTTLILYMLFRMVFRVPLPRNPLW